MIVTKAAAFAMIILSGVNAWITIAAPPVVETVLEAGE